MFLQYRTLGWALVWKHRCSFVIQNLHSNSLQATAAETVTSVPQNALASMQPVASSLPVCKWSFQPGIHCFPTKHKEHSDEFVTCRRLEPHPPSTLGLGCYKNVSSVVLIPMPLHPTSVCAATSHTCYVHAQPDNQLRSKAPNPAHAMAMATHNLCKATRTAFCAYSHHRHQFTPPLPGAGPTVSVISVMPVLLFGLT